ncbi:Phosphatidylinositol 3-kinase regulatory subunit alpha [Labeo rohita]|uniref:Phosphatidylinositol 3-kinase regulatory subunit alpha n=1 Tax=Labeo rohita TaxID=84645 RepID=A0ABQ8ML92_LABRO|nr:Phosphatidylinositol 3-kinase regulatory subunit alpha [Labeo rohita]
MVRGSDHHYPAAVDFEQYELCTLADTLKSYIQDLPCPLIPAVVYSELVYTAQGASMPSSRNAIGRLQDSPSPGCVVLSPDGLGQVPSRGLQPMTLAFIEQGSVSIVSLVLLETQSIEECGQQLKRILDSPSVPQANHQLLVHLTRHLSKVAQSGGAAQASPRLLALAYSEAIFKNNHFSADVNPEHHVKILEALIIVGGLVEIQAAPGRTTNEVLIIF